ncbi:hypothetical protein C3B58_00095 [Lactonifactor longoviformis]|uniref:Proline racemase n=1 Tax=Lactonifactor longoviformis DSM 17459 TaxID=1122155 RepID=A0A1M4Z1L5_9CLOT|nr:proline racemase family protein [Lactonifactor longoviformis]POP35028.1 hypothetical protein C3B58_00095 [Lactonifactor longoviformis]SHF11865.1 Proline racemase [Lactonifactor longoviformis DSM 17459]
MGFKRMFEVVEVHEGDPFHVVVGGLPSIPGDTLREQQLWLKAHDDQVREILMLEPRGMPPTCISILVPPKDPRASAACLFISGGEYALCAGAVVMGTVTVLLETGLLPMQEPLTEFDMEIPAGLIHIEATCKDGKVLNTNFTNVPAFVVCLDKEIDVPHLGKVKIDVAWGGVMFALIDATQFPGLELVPEQGKEICRISALVTKAAQEQITVTHPDHPDIGITASVMFQPPITPGTDMRSANVIYYHPIDFDKPETWTGGLDRGCCGTGTCAFTAVLKERGKLKEGETWVNEGILGIQFTARYTGETMVGDYSAVIPETGGQCWIYGINKWVLDETDPFPHGFTIGDIW